MSVIEVEEKLIVELSLPLYFGIMLLSAYTFVIVISSFYHSKMSLWLCSLS